MIKVLFLFLILSLTSCALQIRYFGEVPVKPGKYPQFTERDTVIWKLDASRDAYDVSYYELDLYLEPVHKTLGGMVTMHFVALKATDTIRFDLYENMSINNIIFNNEPLPPARNDRAVYVTLPEKMIPGNSYSLRVSYSGKPTKARKPPWKGGLVWEKDKSGHPWIGVAVETEGPSLWFPCKDHPSDEPDSMKLTMTVPEGLKVVSNGIMTHHEIGPVTETFTWETHYPINPYNITFYAGYFVHFSDTLNTSQGVLSLDYHVMPENLDIAKLHFTQAKDVIKAFSAVFGPYPWIKEGYKLIESPFEGMEHQTAIAYGNGYKNFRSNGGDYIIIHETAHEWWGNAVSVSDFSDIWLQEGFATYAEIIFAEHELGYNNSLEYVKYSIAPYINNKLPVVGPTDVGFWDHRDNDVYYKGAMVLHTLRNVIADDSLFFDVIRSFYKTYALHSHPTTADFISLVETKTGKEWDDFFDVYLYRREAPCLEWYYNCTSEPLEKLPWVIPDVPFIIARWSRVPEGFSMPVRFMCEDAELSVKLEVTTQPLLFYLPREMNCINPICNPELSYFEKVFSIEVLSEFERL